MICVGSVSKVDVIKHRMLPLPSRFVLNLNNCYLVFALSIDMIGLCLSQYGYSLKENNGYSIYLNKTFNGLAPIGMVYLISIVVIHIFMPKDIR